VTLPRARPADEGGFVLVGAVMIVLALTILGLSLFSLSSFESQFLKRSVDQERAFSAAAGAMERVKFSLLKGGRLEHSWFGFPDGVVDSARAWQWKAGVMVENGPIDAGAVHVRVHARVGEAVQTVSGIFTMNTVDNTYRRLITTSGSVTVTVGAARPANMLRLEGVVYERSPGSGWPALLAPPAPDSIRHSQAWIEDPDVQSAFDAHLATATDATLGVVGGNPEWTFDAVGQQPGYFRVPADLIYNNPGPNFSFVYSGGLFELRVRGPVVWLLPKGFRAFSEMTVNRISGGTDDCLVMIAGVNTDPDPAFFDQGIVLPNGIHNPDDVPIILITPGQIILWRGPDSSPRVLDYLTTYSGGINLAGSLYPYDLLHPIGHPNDQPTGLVDRLLEWGALPGGSASTSSQLQLVSGSWQESRN
jgi:hypothetical protein